MSRTQPEKNGLRNGGGDPSPSDARRPEGARQGTADDCFEAMRRHHERNKSRPNTGDGASEHVATWPEASALYAAFRRGNIVYGADAIARFIFSDYPERDPKKCRRRVYHLWNYYRDRKEPAGFLKLKGTLCLAKSQWRKFHGLD